jgi:SAM-dependent MidA family methyltransferase
MNSQPSQVLPIPDSFDQARSLALCNLIRQKIKDAQPACEGSAPSIGFDEFMSACLYEPGLGYYSSAGAKFGEAGDFITAPMQTPLFGASIGNQCAAWLQQLNNAGELARDGILEFGAGNGLLATQILNELSRTGLPVAYTIIELSADLQAVQRATIASLAPHALHKVSWVSQTPATFRGIVLGNELIDAFPVRLFRFDAQGQLFEKRVTIDNDDFAWVLEPAESGFQANVAQAVKVSPREHPLVNFESELPEQASAWINTVAQFMESGILLLLDYGFPANEFYHPQRSGGTLQCHYRHHSHSEPFYLPGLQDITAHVDFSALTEAAVSSGLDLIGYTTQAHFLINLGILDRLGAMTGDQQYLRHAQAVGRLLSEAEMGELFKAVAFAKLPASLESLESVAFSNSDRSHRL